MTGNKSSKPAPYKRAGVQVHKDGQPGWRLRVFDPRTGRQPETNWYGTYEDATVELDRWRAELAELAQPAPAGSRNQKLATWALAWLADYAWKVKPVGGNAGVQRPETTWKKAKAVLSAYILPALGGRTLASLTYQDCYDFVAGLRVAGGKREASAGTKETVASVLRLVLADAKRAGVVRVNVAADLPTTWGRRKKLVVPSLVQVETLAAKLDEAWPGRGDIVRLFAYTALRWEELSALRWSDVDLVRRTLHVWDTSPAGTGKLTGMVKTDASGRYAAIIDQAVGPLERLRAFAEERGSEFVLTGERGGRLSYGTWRDRLAVARKASGVPYTAHDCRHLCVSLMIAGGATPQEVRDQVGHSRTQVTETVYRHAFSMDRTELAARLTAAVTRVEVDEAAA